MTGASIASFTLGGSIFALFLYMTFYIQDGLGYGPLAAGVRFLPITVMAFVAAPVAGRLTVRVQSRFPMAIGLVLISVGLLLLATTSPSSGWTQLLPGFIVTGTGIGLINPVLASVSVAVVPVQRSGMGSGANATMRQVGIATGIAGLGAIFANRIQHQTAAVLDTSAAGRQILHRGGASLGAALQSGSVRQVLAAIPVRQSRLVLLHAYRVGFSHTFNELMVIGAAVAFVGAVCSLTLVRQRDFVHNTVGAAAQG
jgi:MFS family permease